jgi:phospholipid/cholesterol/gamma-HCH transport system substrate-binding protein
MENKPHALWAGFFTLVMLCVTIAIGIWLNRDQTKRTDYHIVTSRPIVGLNPQASVRYKGLVVGRVTKISFDNEIAGQIDITISVDSKTPITSSTYAVLGYQGVTGIAFVQLDDDGSSQVKLASKQDQTQRIPLRLSLFDKLERSSALILANVELVSERLAQLFTVENQKIMLGAFNGISQVATRWETAADELKPTLQAMPGLVQQTNQTLSSVQVLAQQAIQSSQQLNKTLTTFGSLSEQIQSDTLPRITALTNDASNSMRNALSFAVCR